MLLYFTFLAAAFELKAPVSPFLPPAAHARMRMIEKLYSLPIVKKRIVRGGVESLLYLGYALVLSDIIAQLDRMGAACQVLFGVAGSTDGSTASFEAFFA